MLILLGKIAWVACIEGAAPIENELDRIDILYGLGVQAMGITYSESNALGSIDHVLFGIDSLYGDHVGLHHVFSSNLSTKETSNKIVNMRKFHT